MRPEPYIGEAVIATGIGAGLAVGAEVRIDIELYRRANHRFAIGGANRAHQFTGVLHRHCGQGRIGGRDKHGGSGAAQDRPALRMRLGGADQVVARFNADKSEVTAGADRGAERPGLVSAREQIRDRHAAVGHQRARMAAHAAFENTGAAKEHVLAGARAFHAKGAQGGHADRAGERMGGDDAKAVTHNGQGAAGARVAGLKLEAAVGPGVGAVMAGKQRMAAGQCDRGGANRRDAVAGQHLAADGQAVALRQRRHGAQAIGRQHKVFHHQALFKAQAFERFGRQLGQPFGGGARRRTVQLLAGEMHQRDTLARLHGDAVPLQAQLGSGAHCTDRRVAHGGAGGATIEDHRHGRIATLVERVGILFVVDDQPAVALGTWRDIEHGVAAGRIDHARAHHAAGEVGHQAHAHCHRRGATVFQNFQVPCKVAVLGHVHPARDVQVRGLVQLIDFEHLPRFGLAPDAAVAVLERHADIIDHDLEARGAHIGAAVAAEHAVNAGAERTVALHVEPGAVGVIQVFRHRDRIVEQCHVDHHGVGVKAHRAAVLGHHAPVNAGRAQHEVACRDIGQHVRTVGLGGRAPAAAILRVGVVQRHAGAGARDVLRIFDQARDGAHAKQRQVAGDQLVGADQVEVGARTHPAVDAGRDPVSLPDVEQLEAVAAVGAGGQGAALAAVQAIGAHGNPRLRQGAQALGDNAGDRAYRFTGQCQRQFDRGAIGDGCRARGADAARAGTLFGGDGDVAIEDRAQRDAAVGAGGAAQAGLKLAGAGDAHAYAGQRRIRPRQGGHA